MEVISCKDLSFAYPKSENNVFSRVNLSVNSGEMVLLIGESATGKSTLLKLLKKEIAPFGKKEGEITINGTACYVSQNVYESLVTDRVRSELSFGLTNMGMDGYEIELLVAETASYFNLENKLDSEISSLSGGEVQMLNLASVMIMKPDILLLDEPTSQLDPVSAARFLEMIKRLHRDFSTSIIMAEHNLDSVFDSCNSLLIAEKDKGITKLSPDETIRYLKRIDSPLTALIPIQYRLYDGARTIEQCREILKTKQLNVPDERTEKCDVALKASNISFAYKKGIDILDRLSLKVYKGKINAVLGPNSSGKSTLLYALAGVKKPYYGKIKYNGKISMLCQNVWNLFTKDTCEEEVAFGDLTKFLGIGDELKKRHPYDISGGQAQRIALAKVLETDADIILLDEPTKGFDPLIKKQFASLLSELCKKGKTILIVTHDIEFAGEYADFVSFLSRGKIITTLPRRTFFSSLNFYTTAISKITKGTANNIVSLNDLVEAGGAE